MIPFSPISPGSNRRWAPSRVLPVLAEWDCVPLADSELLSCAHHLPIAIRRNGTRHEVVGVLAPTLQVAPLADDQGRWQRGYTPILLRSFPFALSPDLRDDTLQLVDDPALSGHQFPVIGNDGSLAPRPADIRRLLLKARSGILALSEALERLALADLLVPIELNGRDTGFLTTDTRRLEGLGGFRAGLVSGPNWLALDIAVACVFARPQFGRGVDFGSTAVQSSGGETHRSRDVTIDAVETLSIGFDDSELFSLDMLATAGPTP